MSLASALVIPDHRLSFISLGRRCVHPFTLLRARREAAMQLPHREP
jgi:hypothetical protein